MNKMRQSIPDPSRRATAMNLTAARRRYIRHTLDEMQQLARERGGRCLSDAYHRIDAPMAWTCALGHMWETTARNIMRGTWCPACHESRRSAKKAPHRKASRRRGHWTPPVLNWKAPT
jgi:hypothetical protein